jgi:hypothetical protein
MKIFCRLGRQSGYNTLSDLLSLRSQQRPPMSADHQPSTWLTDTALKVALGYLLVAGLWIFLSDWLISQWLGTPTELSRWQSIKGTAFVVTTSGLLYAYLRHCLRRQQQTYTELTTLFDAFAGAIYVADFTTYELLYVNRFATERFGADWRGRSCHAYFQGNPEGACGFCTNPLLLKDGKPGDPVTWEFRNIRDGRWYQCHDKAIRWSNGRLARMEIAIDVTERMELERSKSELLATVNHEMRTPLTAIAGFAELLTDDPALPPATRQHLRTIFAETEKLQQLIDTFVEVRRLKSDQTRIDYAPLPATTLLTLASDRHPDCSDRHRIEIDAPVDLMLYGNRRELVQAFRQLVANACRFSPQGGDITLRARGDRDSVTLTVTDQGIGIPAEERERIFDAFHRLDIGDRRRSRGVGLGLTLAREILLLHGGSIRAEEAPGGGNRIVVTLPPPPRQRHSPPRQSANAE